MKSEGGTSARWALTLGCSILVSLTTVVVVGVLGLALGVGIGAWLTVPALAAAIWVAFHAWRGAPDRTRRVVITVAAFCVVVVAAHVAASFEGDTSFDGRHYHAEAVWALAGGWNPIRDAALPHPADQGTDRINSFPKAMWIVEATALDVTHNIDSVKGAGLLVAAAVALIGFGVLASLGLAIGWAVVLALVLALNPVASAQFATKMVDGIIGGLLIVAVLLVVLMSVGRRVRLLPATALFGSVLLMINVKYSGLVYAGVLVALAVICAMVVKDMQPRRWALVGLLVASAALGLLVGWNPYVTNTQRHDNPLYILVGKGSVDPAGPQTTGRMKRVSEPERLLISLGARPSNSAANARVRLPLLIKPSDFSAFRSPGLAVGGFGPLFSAVVLGALVLTIIAAATRFRDFHWPAAVLFVSAFLLAGAWVVTPGAWIARLAPELWAVPPLIIAALLIAWTQPLLRFLAIATLVLVTVNAVGVAGAAAVWNRRDTNRQNTSLQRLRALPGPLSVDFGSFSIAEARRLRSAGIEFVRTARVDCARPFLLDVAGSLTRPVHPSADARRRAAAQLCPAA
jgi:hypothetical protein